MEYQKRFNLPGWEKVSDQVLEYITNSTDILQKQLFWNTLHQDIHPELFNLVSPLFDGTGLTIKGLAIIVVATDFAPPHQDALNDNWPNRARINIPILNCSDTRTTFFSANKWEPEFIGHPAAYIHKIENLKIEDYVEVTEPTLLRVDEIHGIISFNKNKPRVTLTCFVDPDPINLLKD